MRTQTIWIAVAAALVLAQAAGAENFRWPVTGHITQCFGESFSGRDAGHYYDEHDVRRWFAGHAATGERMHRAIDIGAATGTPVTAARAGRAYKRGSTSHFYGYHVVIEHGSGYWTLYGHLSAFGGFASGGLVATGEQIGEVGTTGYVTGPHLHFEIRHSSDSVRYAQEAHHIPCHGVGQGKPIAHDYPGIGAVDAAPAGPPAAPAGLSPDGWASIGTGSVRLAWEPPGGATGYDVQIYYWTGSSWSYYYTWSTGGDSFTVWPVVHHTWYAWRVRARGAGGESPWSGWAGFYWDR